MSFSLIIGTTIVDYINAIHRDPMNRYTVIQLISQHSLDQLTVDKTVPIGQFNWTTHCKDPKNIIIVSNYNPFQIPEFLMTFDPKYNTKIFNNVEWIIHLDSVNNVDAKDLYRLVALKPSVLVAHGDSFKTLGFQEPTVLIDGEERVGSDKSELSNESKPLKPEMIVYLDPHTRKGSELFMSLRSLEPYYEILIQSIADGEDLEEFNIDQIPAIYMDDKVYYGKDIRNLLATLKPKHA